MKKILMIALLALLTVNMNCGGGGTSSDTSAKTALTINLGEVRDASSLSASERGMVSTSSIPPYVVSIRITISAPDMPTIVQNIPTAGLTSLSVTIEVPNGPNRHIVVEALNATGGVLYRGETYADLDGTPVSVPITMVSADPVPPAFAGISDITSITQTSMVIWWSPATDNVTPQNKIQYLIYMAMSSGGQNFLVPSFNTSLGATSYMVTGLNPNTTYYFVVLAMDEVGNRSTTIVEASGTTLAPPDTDPPTFGGLESATGLSTTEIGLQWSAATDNVTPSENIIYLIYMATTSGGQNFATPTAMTSPGAVTYTVTGLSPETMYCYVVRAKDEAGNEETNTNEQCATTPPTGGFLSISPVSASVVALTNPDGSPADDVTFTISGGTPPYSVASDNTALIASPGAIGGSTFTVDPDITSSTCSGGLVTLTVTDSGSSAQTATATVDVQRPPAFFSPYGPICENDNTCSAGTETLTLILQGVAPMNLISAIPLVIPSPGSISTYTYTIDAIDNSIGVDTNVLLTLTDSCGDTFDANISVISQDIYVDVNTGDDVTGNGSMSNPFKTITQALSVTPGFEAIHVRLGTHDTAAGETFPLTLKQGTRLDCTYTLADARTLISNPTCASSAIVGAANAMVENCEIEACFGIFDNNMSTNIVNCKINGNALDGIGVNIQNGNSNIQNSEIYNVNGDGILIDTGGFSGSATINNTSVHNNDFGIHIIAPSNVNMTTQPNSIYCNSIADLYVDTSAMAFSYTVDVSNNSWDDSPPYISSPPTCGDDICYDSAYITMIYSPYNSPVPSPPGCPALFMEIKQ